MLTFQWYITVSINKGIYKFERKKNAFDYEKNFKMSKIIIIPKHVWKKNWIIVLQGGETVRQYLVVGSLFSLSLSSGPIPQR